MPLGDWGTMTAFNTASSELQQLHGSSSSGFMKPYPLGKDFFTTPSLSFRNRRTHSFRSALRRSREARLSSAIGPRCLRASAPSLPCRRSPAVPSCAIFFDHLAGERCRRCLMLSAPVQRHRRVCHSAGCIAQVQTSKLTVSPFSKLRPSAMALLCT